jgi:hypothetical protein
MLLGSKSTISDHKLGTNPAMSGTSGSIGREIVLFAQSSEHNRSVAIRQCVTHLE